MSLNPPEIALFGVPSPGLRPGPRKISLGMFKRTLSATRNYVKAAWAMSKCVFKAPPHPHSHHFCLHLHLGPNLNGQVEVGFEKQWVVKKEPGPIPEPSAIRSRGI